MIICELSENFKNEWWKYCKRNVRKCHCNISTCKLYKHLCHYIFNRDIICLTNDDFVKHIRIYNTLNTYK